MKTLIDILRKKFQLAVETAYPQLKNQELPLEVVQSTQDKFGHYQCNSAMKLAKLVGSKPREIAEKMIDSLDLRDIKDSLMIQEFYPLLVQVLSTSRLILNLFLSTLIRC